MTTGRGIALAFLLLLALGSSSAQAGKGTIDVINTPATGLAVNETTGNLYALGEGKVSVFDADGNPQFEFGNGVGPEPSQFASVANGIAIDQTTGHVYVLELQSNYRIQEFEADGTFVRMWGHDVNGSKPSTGFETCTAASGDLCQAGQSGTGPGAFSSESLNSAMYLASDPTTGNLIAADGSNKRLQIFTPEGPFVRAISFDSPALSGINTPSAAAADSHGHILAFGAQTGPNGLEGPIHRFATDGTHLGPFGVAGPAQIAIDSTDDHVYLTRIDAATGDWAVSEYDHDGGLLETHALGIPEPNGLAVNSQSGRIYVSDRAGEDLLIIDEVANPPIPQVTAIDDVTADGATFSGTVNPNGSPYDTNWRFLCTPACPGVAGGNAGNGTADIVVSAEATGLDPNTTYEVRLFATREFGGGAATSAPLTFTTEPVPPEVLKLEAARITDSSARLGALIDANNAQTTYRFEYGTGGSLETTAPASAGDAGDALGPRPVFETITGLAPSTTYRFKVALESSGGAAESAVVEFTTRTSAEGVVPQRGIELVNTPEKSNQNPYGYLTPDGQGVVWAVFTGGPNAPIGRGAAFLAQRTPNAWVSRNLVPPASSQHGGGEFAYNLMGATDDYSEILFQIGELPRDGGIEPDVTLVRVGPNFEQEVVHTTPAVDGTEVFWPDSTTAADGVRLAFMLTQQQMDPSHPTGLLQVYNVAADPPILISRMPGTPNAMPCGLADQGFGYSAGLAEPRQWISTDGSRVFFESAGEICEDLPNLFMYSSQGTDAPTDDTTVLISGPPVTGADLGGTLIDAATDGKAAVFLSESRLVAADGNETDDIYRWSDPAGLECLTCVVPEAAVARESGYRNPEAAASDDLSHVYFISRKQILPGEGDEGAQNLYVWRDGAIDYIGPSDGLVDGPNEMTPDGDVFIFRTDEPGVTVDDNGGLRQYYRYDDRTGTVECMSCAPSHGDPAAVETEMPLPLGLAAPPPRLKRFRLTADGETFVFVTAARMVPRDVNGQRDIYQWHRGRIALITDGVSDFDPPGAATDRLEFLGLSRDGANVLFKTAVPLTGHERDDLAQLYVARIDGGLPGPAQPQEPCAEDACQGPLFAPPGVPTPASAAAVGPGNAQKAKRRPPCRGKKGKAKRRCLKQRKSKQARRGSKQAGRGGQRK